MVSAAACFVLAVFPPLFTVLAHVAADGKRRADAPVRDAEGRSTGGSFEKTPAGFCARKKVKLFSSQISTGGNEMSRTTNAKNTHTLSRPPFP